MISRCSVLEESFQDAISHHGHWRRFVNKMMLPNVAKREAESSLQMITHRRTQHAVGQGFFHSADIETSAGGRIRYVYDCGALDKFRAARDSCVQSFLHAVGPKAKLDFLFISHAHFDHVSGLPTLLDTANGGVQVDTIVMPLMDVYDRLLVFARAASEDAAMAQDSFYRNFVSDPIETLQTFNPRQILLVRRGNSLDGPPGGDGAGEPGPLLGDGPVPMKIIGKGPVGVGDVTKAGTAITVMPDTRYIALAVESLTWLLSPYVDPSVNAGRSNFRASLALELKMSTRSLGQWLRSSRNRIDLLTNRLQSLERAYKSIKSNINITSMCLFSGPMPDMNTLFVDHRWTAGKFRGREVKGRIAWLSTGDAALAEKGRRRAMLDHYRILVPTVLSFTLPHHGAAANYHEELVRHVDPHFCVVAADHFSKKWSHPGAQVVHSVASHGSLLFTVTAAPISEFREIVLIH